MAINPYSYLLPIPPKVEWELAGEINLPTITNLSLITCGLELVENFVNGNCAAVNIKWLETMLPRLSALKVLRLDCVFDDEKRPQNAERIRRSFSYDTLVRRVRNTTLTSLEIHIFKRPRYSTADQRMWATRPHDWSMSLLTAPGHYSYHRPQVLNASSLLHLPRLENVSAPQEMFFGIDGADVTSFRPCLLPPSIKFIRICDTSEMLQTWAEWILESRNHDFPNFSQIMISRWHQGAHLLPVDAGWRERGWFKFDMQGLLLGITDKSSVWQRLNDVGVRTIDEGKVIDWKTWWIGQNVNEKEDEHPQDIGLPS